MAIALTLEDELYYFRELRKYYTLLAVFERQKCDLIAKYAQAAVNGDKNKLIHIHDEMIGTLDLLKCYDHEIGRLITEKKDKEKDND